MIVSRNHILKGKHNRPILLDFGYKSDGLKKPIIVFAHGFKGFKDWGHFNKIMEYFIEKGFAFVKFNFSHNGGTVEQPVDFPDLEAFGNNNYTKELDDLKTVIDWVYALKNTEINGDQICLIGHSRGGGISIIAAYEDDRIRKLITWAAVADLINRYPKDVIDLWRKEGVLYIKNGRTNQQMPLYYQFAEDTVKNKGRFSVERAVLGLAIPHLILHGTADEAVSVNEAHEIESWSKAAKTIIIEGAGHTFGAKHPFEEREFSKDTQIVLEETLNFIRD